MRISLIARSVRATGGSNASLAHARNLSAPAPIPSSARPSVSSASDAATIAISDACIETGLNTPTPSSMRLVACAAAVTSTGAEWKNRSFDTQTWSKPPSSASAASRANSAGATSLLKRTLNVSFMGG